MNMITMNKPIQTRVKKGKLKRLEPTSIQVF